MEAERLTVPQLLHRHASEIPDHPFVVTEDATVTYAALDEQSRSIAADLVARGVTKGTRVGLLMANGTEWAVIAFGVMRIGAVLVPLSTLLTPSELAANLRAAGVEHLVAAPRTRTRDHLADLREIAPGLTPEHTPLRDPALPRLRSILVADPSPSSSGSPSPSDSPSPSGSGPRFLPYGGGNAGQNGGEAGDGRQEDGVAALVDELGSLVRPADDMAIIFTSGSRGTPKAVIHTHGGALGATQAGLGARCIGPDDRLYLPMPFFWMGGFGGGLITAFVAGATLVTEAEPSPERTLRLLERERVTLFRGWPDQAAALAAHPAFATADLSSLRPGSLDALLPAHLQAPPGTRPVLFGMTETFGPYCADPLDSTLPPDKHGSLGRPFPGVEVRIADPDTSAPLPTGEVGEILVRGPNVMRGICGREREDTFTADGFYPTGDSGRLDADGYLWFTGRLDDMFKVNGASVYPAEVEAALEGLDDVRRAFAVDIEIDGARRVGAAVVLTPECDRSVDDLAADARRVLSAFKVPVRWRIVEPDDVPRTATGKVDKDALRRLVEAVEATP